MVALLVLPSLEKVFGRKKMFDVRGLFGRNVFKIDPAAHKYVIFVGHIMICTYIHLFQLRLLQRRNYA